MAMDSLVSVNGVLEQAMWVRSLDLSDAYYHIPIIKEDTKSMCFKVERRQFVHLVLSIGLMSVLWTFTEVKADQALATREAVDAFSVPEDRQYYSNIMAKKNWEECNCEPSS